MKEWYSKEYYENRLKGERYPSKIHKLCSAILKYNPKRVLDVGCGNGVLARTLFDEYGIDAWGLDFSYYAGGLIEERFIKHDISEPLPFQDKEFEVVVSADFFEHLSEEIIENVCREMRRVGKNVIAYICYKKDRLLRGEKIDTHLTVKPKDWWIEKLKGVEIL